MRSRRQALLLAAGLALLALLLFLSRTTSPETPPASPTATAAPLPEPREGSRPRPPRPASVQTSAPPLAPPLAHLPPARAPVIDSVTFDKPSVCFNEEVLVTVKARGADGREDPFLRYRVAGEPGPRVALRRLTVPSPGGPPERGGHAVTVSGRDGTHVTVALPALAVKDCRVPDEFELVHALAPGTEDVVRLLASPVGHNPDLDAVQRQGTDDAPPFVPVRYVWSFGDGTTAETHEASLVHDFGARPQATLYSYFLVTCQAFDARGLALGARVSLELKNTAFESFMTRGTVRLLTRVLPPVEDASGHVTVPVRLWHTWPTPLTVTAVRRRLHSGQALHAADARSPLVPPGEDVAPEAVLGGTRIPPGGLIVPMRFAVGADADLAALEFRLEGETSEGWPVKGHFIAARPGLAPLEHRMLVDTEWRAKVLRARAHLDRADVSAEEVMALEAQGLFQDLPRAFQGTPPPGFAPPVSPVPDEAW